MCKTVLNFTKTREKREATSVGEMMKILESHLNIQLEGMSLDDDVRVQLGD